MIGAKIDEDSLEVQVTGGDWWPHCLNSSALTSWLIVRLPLDHITAARVHPPRKGIRHPNQPAHVQRDGTFRGDGLVWCRRGAPVLWLDMDGQPYTHVVLSVPDPERLAEEVRIAARAPELVENP
jgi:hypothetical protein